MPSAISGPAGLVLIPSALHHNRCPVSRRPRASPYTRACKDERAFARLPLAQPNSSAGHSVWLFIVPAPCCPPEPRARLRGGLRHKGGKATHSSEPKVCSQRGMLESSVTPSRASKTRRRHFFEARPPVILLHGARISPKRRGKNTDRGQALTPPCPGVAWPTLPSPACPSLTCTC